MSAYLDAMRRYATFSGRSTRKEFWYYHLVLLGLAIGGLIIDVAIAGPREPQPVVSALIIMGHYVPSLAVIVRRLHDVGKSGWLVLTCLIPLVGIVAFIVIGSTSSEYGATDFREHRDQRPTPPLPPSGSDQQIERIEKLAALRSSGAITAEEFETMKGGIIGSDQLSKERQTAAYPMEKPS